MNALDKCENLNRETVEIHQVEHDPSTESASEVVDDWSDINLKGGFSGGGNSDAALILFAVIGIVIIIAVIPYAISYLYELAAGHDLCYFHEISLTRISMRSEKQLKDGALLTQDSDFGSIGYSINVDRTNHADLGLAFELGWHRVKGHSDNNLHLDLNEEGSFFLVGPRLYFARHLPSRSHGFLELLGGRSTNDNVVTMAKAQIGFKYYPASSRFGIGAAVGSLYTDLAVRGGLLSERDKFDLFFAVSLATSFGS
jgi:hypothetical protein